MYLFFSHIFSKNLILIAQKCTYKLSLFVNLFSALLKKNTQVVDVVQIVSILIVIIFEDTKSLQIKHVFPLYTC